MVKIEYINEYCYHAMEDLCKVYYYAKYAVESRK